MILHWDEPFAQLLVIANVMIPAVMPIAPGLALSYWARRRLVTVERESRNPPADPTLNGAQAAARLLEIANVSDISIIEANGPLATFYDPVCQEIRLAPALFRGSTPYVWGVVVHEVGHALQDIQWPFLAKIRVAWVIGCKLARGASLLVIASAILMLNASLCESGCLLFSASILALLPLQLIESDANRRCMGFVKQWEIDDPISIRQPQLKRISRASSWSDIASTFPDPLAFWNRRHQVWN